MSEKSKSNKDIRTMKYENYFKKGFQDGYEGRRKQHNEATDLTPDEQDKITAYLNGYHSGQIQRREEKGW